MNLKNAEGQIGNSRSNDHHSEMYQVKHVYGESNNIYRTHVITIKSVLGYKYHWQFSLFENVNHMKYKLCGQGCENTLE